MNTIIDTLYYLLNSIYSFTGDFGISIILLTFIVKIILMPLSIKQKRGFTEQQDYSNKIKELQEKYKNDKERFNAEAAKIGTQNLKSFLGCLLTFAQIPILFALYNVFNKMPMDVGSILVPWVSSLKSIDSFFIIPIFSTIVQLIPSILQSVGVFKNINTPKLTLVQISISLGFNLLFLSHAPIGLGLYWISSGLYNVFEQIVFNSFYRNKISLQS